MNMSLKDKITGDLTAAMKAKDANRLSVLRMVKANIMNRQIEKGSDLTDDEITKALQSLVKQRKDSIDQYQKAGRNELAEKEQSELLVLEDYLPRAASLKEIEKAIVEAIQETGASSMKEMGAVMKSAQAKLAGKSADGRIMSETVKSKLQG